MLETYSNHNRSPERPTINARHYKKRMRKFMSALPASSVAIFVSNPEQTRSNDTEYPYRQSSDILYLNGFSEPNSILVLTNAGSKRGKLIMFVQPKDASREQWTGIRTGIAGATRSYLADEAYGIDDFEKILGRLLVSAEHVYYKFERNPEVDKRFEKVFAAQHQTLGNPENILHAMRMVKGEEEIEMIKEACRISGEAHRQAALQIRPGLKEYQIQATMEFVFMENGASAPAYGSIVAGGANAWVLHYVSNRDELKDGDLVLIDAAAEYHGYAADITRTLPVNGKFNAAQRQIYQLVLDAQNAAIKAVKPGVTLRVVHMAASTVLRCGLVRLGILPPQMASRARETRMLKSARKEGKGKEKELVALSTFFPHGTSHWMGLDVHDVGPGSNHRNHALTPGMVLTVEPGLYFDASDERVPEQFRGIGVRIEDDVLVTEDGNSVLSSAMPKEIADVERLMGEGKNRYS